MSPRTAPGIRHSNPASSGKKRNVPIGCSSFIVRICPPLLRRRGRQQDEGSGAGVKLDRKGDLAFTVEGDPERWRRVVWQRDLGDRAQIGFGAALQDQ